MAPPTSEVIVVGGGAAGFFAAITAAEGGASVRILEKSPQVLAKVRISGGGRCNVTHACFDPREFARRYPRGDQALIGPLRRFSASQTIEWFRQRGVELKTEDDGRMFPTTDTSQTILDCLQRAATEAGVAVRVNAEVEDIRRRPDGRFELRVVGGGGTMTLEADRVLLAMGGCRTPALGRLPEQLGHTIEPPVPSLFTFHVAVDWLRKLAGVSVAETEVSLPDLGGTQRGPLLLTHWGLSGPVILRLSAWGARELAGVDYRTRVRVNWLVGRTEEQLRAEFQERRERQGAKLVVNVPVAPLTARLWEQLVFAAGIPRPTQWASLSKGQANELLRQLLRTEWPIAGKSLNKDEFVTCGGVRLGEVNLKTMESRVCPGLFLAGELLDVDGITGGFNFQAAWTTGWIAGQALAEPVARRG